MKIFSIKEIVEATNNIFYSKDAKVEKIKTKKTIKIKSNKIDQPLLLETEIIKENKEKLNPKNNKIVIENKVKDLMIHELYIFMKKKIKKNTLKLIVDEQIEIKNLKNEIILLKQDKDRLIQNYDILKNDYEIVFKNYKNLKISNEKLNLQNRDLKTNNGILKESLSNINHKYQELSIENKELLTENVQLQNDLSLVTQEKENLTKENNGFNNLLKEKDENLQVINQKNRSFEINNAELKNTISRYIINLKKLQEQVDLTEKSKSHELKEINKKIQFYQDENVRLSGELLLFQRKNENIKSNLADIENEKLKISNKIKELSKSIDQKTNVVETKFIKENYKAPSDDLDKLNDKEQKSLDEVISRIFNKI